jgi:hypothetical protein
MSDDVHDGRTIDDAALFKSLEWIKNNAKNIAEARSRRSLMEEWPSVVRARVAKECIHAGSSAAAADVEAKASTAYEDALKAQEAAVFNDELLRIKRIQAEAIIEIWRTLSANRRAMDKVGV